ncbi:type III restriction-modification system endonuclease [Dietzia cinnamea]|uniref:Type III restriction-modification system endonuclease n=1 Tax=Dietzia cinnamea TaxID=321318 RepID=A0AAW5Q7A1_9ACTN|nr:type III restriction-modification system endonuclease [Dietzia cinnamea]MCT2033592.1 type III restriction-modification system endonuclease [Dietzia cinnamea]MCT2108751.1 type III restriction-modification system endonuclease [Dietzia cinnamea]MCT2117702.1 type III restriction-modification system endonuclease [Dietzia cinnamea]
MMQIRLQTLEHQQRALTALTHVFDGVELDTNTQPEANVGFDVADPQIAHNIANIQAGAIDGIDAIPRPWRGRIDDGMLGIDAKMETGTGKTLVYTQLMYELNRLYGFTKFIILVPSTPIKEGTKAFVQSEYARKYFADAYGNRISLQVDVLEPQKRSKGRKMFPGAISSFAQSSRLSRGRISALLMTGDMLLSKPTMETNYDQTVLGTASVPYEALRRTRPIVIMDEPHRFRRENKAYRAVLEKLQPLAIFRFGATFPKLDKSGKTDYNNLIFNLGAVEAFNEQLVKGVAIQYPVDATGETTRLKLTSLSARKPKQATFQNLDTGKALTFDLGESLAVADGAFAGITVEEIGKTDHPAIKSGVTLSNDQVLATGDTLAARVYSDTYQSLMMQQALDNHFEVEWENFRRATKVKTLTLFFIDSIESYRGDGTSGHLRVRFEELLATKLTAEIDRRRADTSPVAQEYVAYLKASLADVSATNGGYFSADNSNADEAIRAEVDDILRNKEALLSFNGPDGIPNTRRFLFSKWTLREGWDSPNVFQIVKLRSSGSEISKLQEVGRGLRLPVDAKGTRLTGEQFYLTYLIDFTERSFADSLVSEINSDAAVGAATVKELLPKVSAELGMDETQLFIELLTKGLVDSDKNVVSGRENDLYDAYPSFNKAGLKPDKIRKNGKPAKVGIRPERYGELKDLWETVNAKYYLRLDDLSPKEIDTCIDAVLDQDVYRPVVGRFTQDTIVQDSETRLALRTETKRVFDATEKIPYGEWLKLAFAQTYLPIDRIHAGLVRLNAKAPLSDDFFNKATLGVFVLQFTGWMQKAFLERFSYSRIEGRLSGTELTDADGAPLESIVQGNIGVLRDDTMKVPDKFLYDAFVYDSPKEHATIRDSTLDEVVVYGKIPRKSIKVPLYFGGTTSPDFMYVLKRGDGKLSLNFVVETKDVEKGSDMRGGDPLRMEAAKRFFESMNSESFDVAFRPQVRSDDIVTMIKQLLA